MVLMYLYLMMLVLVIFFLFILNYVLSMYLYKDKEKFSNFECGFSLFGGSRLSFSMRYFLLTVIFVVFDVEVVLLFPGLLIFFQFFNFFFVFLWIFFLIILYVGVVFEFKEGALSWVY